MRFLGRCWHIQDYQEKKNAVDMIMALHATTLRQRQEQAHEYYRQKCLELVDFFLNHGVDINKQTDDNEVK